MKKYLKRFLSLLVISIFASALVSCSDENKKEYTPEQSLKVYLDIVIKGNGDEGSSIGLKDNQVKELLKLRDKGFKEAVESQEYKDIIDDTMKEDFLNGVYKALDKVEYTCTTSDVTEDKSVLELELKGIDMKKLEEDTMKEVLENVDSFLNMKDSEVEKEVLKALFKNLESVSIVSTPNKFTVNMEKKNNTWIINEDELDTILNAVIAQ